MVLIMLYFDCSTYFERKIVMINSKRVDLLYLFLPITLFGIIVIFIVNYKSIMDIFYLFIIFIFTVKLTIEFYIK